MAQPYSRQSFQSLPQAPTPTEGRYIEGFLSDQLSVRGGSHHLSHLEQQQHLGPERPASGLSCRTGMSRALEEDGASSMRDYPWQGDEHEGEEHEATEEIGRTGERARLTGMDRMRNDVLREEHRKLEPLRKRQAQMDAAQELVRQATLVSKSLSRQLRDSQAREAASQISVGLALAKSSAETEAARELKGQLARSKMLLEKEQDEGRRARHELEQLKEKEKEARKRLLRYHEELKLRDAISEGRRQGKEEALFEMTHWANLAGRPASPPRALPPEAKAAPRPRSPSPLPPSLLPSLSPQPRSPFPSPASPDPAPSKAGVSPEPPHRALSPSDNQPRPFNDNPSSVALVPTAPAPQIIYNVYGAPPAPTPSAPLAAPTLVPTSVPASALSVQPYLKPSPSSSSPRRISPVLQDVVQPAATSAGPPDYRPSALTPPQLAPSSRARSRSNSFGAASAALRPPVAAPRPGPQPRHRPAQASISTIATGPLQRQQRTSMELIDSRGLRDSKYPSFSASASLGTHHPSRTRAADVDVYPKLPDRARRTSVEDKWEGEERNLASPPPSESSAAGSGRAWQNSHFEPPTYHPSAQTQRANGPASASSHGPAGKRLPALIMPQALASQTPAASSGLPKTAQSSLTTGLGHQIGVDRSRRGSDARSGRDSIAPSIFVQPPSHSSKNRSAAPSPNPAVVPLPASRAPTVYEPSPVSAPLPPSRAPPRAPTIYHHSQPSVPFKLPSPAAANAPAAIPAVLPPGQISARNVPLPQSVFGGDSSDRNSVAVSTTETNRPPRPILAAGTVPTPSPLAKGISRPQSIYPSAGAVSRDRPSSPLLSPDDARSRPPSRTVSPSPDGPGPSRSRSASFSILKSSPQAMAVPWLDNPLSTATPRRIPSPMRSRPISTHTIRVPPPPLPPKDQSAPLRVHPPPVTSDHGRLDRPQLPFSKARSATVRSVDSDDSEWQGQKQQSVLRGRPRSLVGGQQGASHQGAGTRSVDGRSVGGRSRRPPTTHGGKSASTITEEMLDEATRQRPREV